VHYIITEETPLENPFWQYSRDKIAVEQRLMGVRIEVVKVRQHGRRHERPELVAGAVGEVARGANAVLEGELLIDRGGVEFVQGVRDRDVLPVGRLQMELDVGRVRGARPLKGDR
jgi:hypothetical protein